MSAAMPHSVKTESLTNQVYKAIREQIGSRDFRPGERIYEQVLAQRMSISRTPIREALLKLERDGLVICNSRRREKRNKAIRVQQAIKHCDLFTAFSLHIGTAEHRMPWP